MAADDLSEVIARLSRLQVKVDNMLKVGSVHEVKSGGGEQKVRVNIGMDADGQPVLGPWLHTANARGGAREEHRYVQDQNVILISPGGDHRQALVIQHGESTARPRPDQASDDSETYQYYAIRRKQTTSLYERWLAKESSSQSTNVGGAASGG